MSDEARVEVLLVPKGSIVWLHNVADTGDDFGAELLQEMVRAVGHKQFCVLVTNGDGVVEVLGADEIVERVRAALSVESPQPCSHCFETGGHLMHCPNSASA